jgi:phenylacetate-coenzyme A ligase PaaK-like adenylate-forming protein
MEVNQIHGLVSKPKAYFQWLREAIHQFGFESVALSIYRYQSESIPIYSAYHQQIGYSASQAQRVEDILFLPISFFKTHDVVHPDLPIEKIFESSGTTGTINSQHKVCSLKLYRDSFMQCFADIYGQPEQYGFIGLLPSYLERNTSSLIYMVNELMNLSNCPVNGFYKEINKELIELLCANRGYPVIMFGVTFALLQLAEMDVRLKDVIVIETGGMKGRGKEMIREELYRHLREKLGVDDIHSEYGMTELLSQAYSQNDGNFRCPEWMKILRREVQDPFSVSISSGSGAVNIIDLANLYSCCFIETQDLCQLYSDGSFKIMGRMDYSDIRGCNLLMIN